MDPVTLALAKGYTDEKIGALPAESLLVAVADLRSVVAWDTFRRPNGPIGTSDSGHVWENVFGNWTISNNRVGGSGDGGICVVDVGTSYQSIEITGSHPVQSRQFGIIGLFVDMNNYVRLLTGRDTIQLQVRLEGVTSVLFSRDYSSANEWAGYRSLRLDLRPNGSRNRIKARCFLDGEFLTEATIGESGFNILNGATKCGLYNDYSSANIYRFVTRRLSMVP